MDWSQMWTQIQILFVSTIAITFASIVALVIISGSLFWQKSPLQPLIAPFRDELHKMAQWFNRNLVAAANENKAHVIGAIIVAMGLAAFGTATLVGLVLNALLSNPL